MSNCGPATSLSTIYFAIGGVC